MVYLDYNATTPIDKDVVVSINEAMLNAWGNPSSNSEAGILAKETIKKSRNYVADMIKANNPNEIIFTSGGTEANNMVIHTAILNFRRENFPPNGKIIRVPHIITSNIEHDSITLPLMHFQEKNQIELSIVPVSKTTGDIDVVDIIDHIKPNTSLITVMLANNETGIIQLISHIGQSLISINKTRNQSNLPKIFFHTDAAQAIGKIPVDVRELAVDYLTIVGHKFYGPRIGALYVKHLDSSHDTLLRPFFYGGGQERNYRPGTENTPMIAGLGKASHLVSSNIEKYQEIMAEMRNYLEDQLRNQFGDEVMFNSVRNGVERLPNTCSVGFKNCSLTGRDILTQAKDIEASVGAACHGSKNSKPSAVLLASGVNKEIAMATLRLSVGRETTKADIDKAVSTLKRVLENDIQNIY